jgi:hypothetical protein
MIMDLAIRCVGKAAGPARWNPTQAKVRLEWGTHHLLPVEAGTQGKAFEKIRLRPRYAGANLGHPSRTIDQIVVRGQSF